MIPIFKVTPTPGMCIKTKNVKDEKVFINLCKIQEIPPAPPLSEEKLKDIIASEDYSSDFRYYIFSPNYSSKINQNTNLFKLNLALNIFQSTDELRRTAGRKRQVGRKMFGLGCSNKLNMVSFIMFYPIFNISDLTLKFTQFVIEDISFLFRIGMKKPWRIALPSQPSL